MNASPHTPALPVDAPSLGFAYGEDVDEVHEFIEARRLALEHSGKGGFLLPRSRADILAMLGESPGAPWGPRGLTVCARDQRRALVGTCLLHFGIVGNTARALAGCWLEPDLSKVVTGSSLVVHPTQSGRGLGAALNAAAIAIARDAELLYLGSVNSHNTSALGLHLRQGALLLAPLASQVLPGSHSILLAFCEPRALGFSLPHAPAATYPADAPPRDWIDELMRGRVGALRARQLCFFDR